MKTYIITQEHKERLFSLIDELITAPWCFDKIGDLQRAMDEFDALPETAISSPIKEDNLCDECREPVPLGDLFWHNDERDGFFCQKCFRKLEGGTGPGYGMLNKPRCNECGKLAVAYSHSPYLAELHPENENPEEWWCENCLQEDADNI